MNILHFNQPIRRRVLIFGAAVVILTFYCPTVIARAQELPPNSESDRKTEKIHITADLLTSDSEARYAEFNGNVRAVQGDTVITSDRLKIYYSEGLSNSGKTASGQTPIKKIVATDNVKILFDNRVAVTRQAVYNIETKIIVLSGPDSKITSGADSITGEKITYNRSDGRITVEGSRDNRVEAVFHSGGNGIR